MPTVRSGRHFVSVVITAHNEGDEVRRTVESIRAEVSSAGDEIILVDDGSSDGCCDGVGDRVRVIRHAFRIGIGYSRHEAFLVAKGDVVAFLDGHQRVESGSLELCSELAVRTNSIVCPDICGLDDDERLHGSYFVVCPTNKYFSATWKRRMPLGGIGRVSSLKAPAYFIPKCIYPRVKWSPELRGWGASEACVSLKAFFTGVEILHFCGPLIRHQFKPKFHYEVGWPEIWRNQAIIARICFSDRSWYDYWLPEVFESHLSEEVRKELESDTIKAEQSEFSRIKVRSDEEFWTRLVFQKVPASLR